MDQKDYNKWFNATFEKMKIADENEEAGYGEWLKSNEDIVDEKITNNNQMNEYIQNKKKELRAVVVHKEFQDLNNDSHFNLVRDTPAEFGSSVFDKLQFQDLKQAHVESVIPVTEEDFHKRKKYTNIDELNRDRTEDSIRGKTEWSASHEEKLKQANTKDEDINIQRAYKLMNQDEKIRENYDIFWSDLKRLKN